MDIVSVYCELGGALMVSGKIGETSDLLKKGVVIFTGSNVHIQMLLDV